MALDAHVPMILRDGTLYDADLDRSSATFLSMAFVPAIPFVPMATMFWSGLVFLSEACAKTIWQADRHDVLAITASAAAPRADNASPLLPGTSAVACLDRLYRWGLQEGLIAEAPFTHRSVWRRGYAGQRAQVAARNDAYERASRRADVSFVTLDDYRRFRDVGLKAHLPDGRTRPAPEIAMGFAMRCFPISW